MEYNRNSSCLCTYRSISCSLYTELGAVDTEDEAVELDESVDEEDVLDLEDDSFATFCCRFLLICSNDSDFSSTDHIRRYLLLTLADTGPPITGNMVPTNGDSDLPLTLTYG